MQASDHLHTFSKSKHLLGSEVSLCDHPLAQTPKEAFPGLWSEFMPELSYIIQLTQMEFEVDRPPPADSPPEDLLIPMVKETEILYRKSLKIKIVKLVRISHLCDSD